MEDSCPKHDGAGPESVCSRAGNHIGADGLKTRAAINVYEELPSSSPIQMAGSSFIAQIDMEDE